MATGDRLFVMFESESAHRYFVSAWMFLEDAVARATKETNPYKRVFQLQRLLGPCATNLRMACETHFGNLDKAPSQDLAWFLSAARHVSSHAVNEAGRGRVHAANLHWDNKTNTGSVETEVVMDLDLKKSDLNAERLAMATAFLASHGNDIFLALHSAAHTVAGWIGEKVDDDFHALRAANVGRFRFRLPISDPEVWRKTLQDLTPE